MEIQDEKTVYVVMGTVDKTEGRTPLYPDKVCSFESTAKRLSIGAFVMGSNSPVEKMKAYKINGRWYYPARLIHPSADDEREQIRINANEQRVKKRSEALERAKALGLSAEDLKLLE